MPAATEFVFFGDSLSDPGNLYDLSQGLIPDELRDTLGGPTNSVSDGIVFPEYLDQISGSGAALNYAIAGALAGGTLSLGELIAASGLETELLVPLDDPALQFDINLGAQVDRFTSDFSGQDLSQQTGFILIGGNDYAGIDTSDVATALSQFLTQVFVSVGAILSSVAQLDAAGMGRVIVSTLPDASFFPRATDLPPGEQLIAELAFGVHDALLRAGVEDLAEQGIAVEIVELGPVTAALAQDPESFGILAPLTEQLSTGEVLQDFDPDQVGFWDDIHPSTAVHGVLAAYLAHATQNPVHDLGDSSDLRVYGAADDLIFGNAGNDLLASGLGDDLGFGGQGDDRLWAGVGQDLGSGGSGDDRLHGGLGNDLLDGDSGDDLLLGGMGNDLLIDGLGNDVLIGGYGADDFVFTQAELIDGAGPQNDLIIGGGGYDRLFLVLDSATAQSFGAQVSAAELASIGLTAIGIEEIVVLQGREQLSSLSGEAWYDQADIWGLI